MQEIAFSDRNELVRKNQLRSKLQELLSNGGPSFPALDADEVVIYGAGLWGKRVCQSAGARGIRVRCFVDARAEASGVVEGVPRYASDSDKVCEAATDGLPVIVAVFNYMAGLRPILALLRDAGFKRIINFYEIHEQFGYPPHFWLGSRRSYAAFASDIVRGFDLLSEEKTRQVYYDHIALRLTFDTRLLAAPDLNDQYLPSDRPAWKEPLRLIDGGALNCDTIRVLCLGGMKCEAVAAFEPDPANFTALCAIAANLRDRINEIILLPCGLANKTAMFSFAVDAGMGSASQEDGEAQIRVVAIDDVIPTFAPNFIKLDIEGFEPYALQGAANTIRRHKPQLAVSGYHAPEHLWSIPILLHELSNDYRFAIRSHQFNGLETVVYGFPS